ncbi:MAG: hydroxymethylbilane synthase, partial [Bacteroidia bacterium]|nr:hydroxymethylbilane synthase [Bacteroidia bacterium]
MPARPDIKKHLSDMRSDGETIRLIARNSQLSILQLEKTKHKIESSFPGIEVKTILRSSRGDELQDVPLQTVEGSDFFTRDIFDALANNEADIAIHSLKDMSSEHFFGKNIFALIDRDDVRDIAIFRKETEQKIKNGETIFIGTCSPRRELMATVFLQKALPQWNNNFKVETKSIRGNVDTRLRKLNSREYDGIILATAGLNRLLENEKDSSAIRNLLTDKKIMLLPLVECVPAPCQGAIVAEANANNRKAVEVLERINDKTHMEECVQEKQTALQYGAGCLQKFGVTTISYGSSKAVYASGMDSNGNTFSNWSGLPELKIGNGKLFDATRFMGSFFNYEYIHEISKIKEPVVYVANFKAAGQKEVIEQLRLKKVWASGSRTWLDLAKKGIWVEGCADAFGLEFLQPVWAMPILSISKKDIAIVTGSEAATVWQAKGWKTYATYKQLEKISPEF